MVRLVIKNHRPWQMALAIITLSMVISLITWLFLDNNHWQVIHKQLSGNTSAKELIEENQVLQAQNSELNGKILMLDQTTRLDQETAIGMQQELKGLQDEIYKLKRELEFYKGVMDTSKSASGFDIHGIYIEPLNKPSHYHMKVVLTNVDKANRILQGSLDMDIDGMQNNRKQTLNISTIVVDELGGLSFELKNFKQIELNFALPLEFEPERVRVIANLNKTNIPPIIRLYEWPITVNIIE
jgi:hypothetical protein